MKKLLVCILSLIAALSLTSCVTTVSAQDEMYSHSVTEYYDDAEMEVVIRCGVPHIIDGLVMYYIYNDLYYYPYYYRDVLYWKIYRAPLSVYPRYWRPVPRGYWFRGERFHAPHRFDRKHYDGFRGNHHGVHPGNHHGHHNGMGNGKPNHPSKGHVTPHNPGQRNGIGNTNRFPSPYSNERSRSVAPRRTQTPSGVSRPATPRTSRPPVISRPSSTRMSAPPRMSSSPARSASPARSGGGHFGGRR